MPGNGGGPGRPKGSPNKMPLEIKAMVHEALEAEGGVEYLREQARENPVAFLGLVRAIIPREVALPADTQISEITVRWVKPDFMLEAELVSPNEPAPAPLLVDQGGDR